MGAATKLRLAIYLPLVVLAAIVVLPRIAASDDSRPVAKVRPPQVRWARVDEWRVETFDGRTKVLPVSGEVTLVESPSLRLEVRAQINRHTRAIDRVWTSVGRWRIAIDGYGHAWINGRLQEIADGWHVDLGDGAYLYQKDGRYSVNWPGTGFRPRLRMRGHVVTVRTPLNVRDVRGLLGNADGEPGND